MQKDNEVIKRLNKTKEERKPDLRQEKEDRDMKERQEQKKKQQEQVMPGCPINDTVEQVMPGRPINDTMEQVMLGCPINDRYSGTSLFQVSELQPKSISMHCIERLIFYIH